MDKQLETEPKPKKKVGRPRKYHTDEEYKAARKIQNDKYTAKIKKMRELCQQIGECLWNILKVKSLPFTMPYTSNNLMGYIIN